MKRGLIGISLLLLSVPLVLVVLSELGEVVVIRSQVAGDVRETRIWVIERPDGLWVRGDEGKAWVADARRAGAVELDRDGETRRYRVVEWRDTAARGRVNVWMREKYGLADRLIGLLRDYDTAVPLLLVPAEPSS